MTPDKICVVLVEPKGAGNIGSVCRVMMNFGFSDLRLVNPRVDHLCDEARHMAVKAANLLETVSLHADLAGALADCHFSLGTTRRFGKYREEFLHPDKAASLIYELPEDSRAALVFGREDKGLQASELDLCQQFITIPTSEDFPSMNLAQAVSLCLYELATASDIAPEEPLSDIPPASGETMELMCQHMQKTLLDIGYLDPQNPNHLMRTFRRIFGRQLLNEREVRILRGLWSRIDWLKGGLDEGKQKGSE